MLVVVAHIAIEIVGVQALRVPKKAKDPATRANAHH